MNRWEIILGIVFGLLVNEVTDISPWLAQKLARWSAYRWTTDPEMAAAYAEEWAALIDDRPGKLLKLLTALRFTLGAAGRAAPRAGIRAIRAVRRRTQLRAYAEKFLRLDEADKAARRLVTTDTPILVSTDAWDSYDLKADGLLVEVKDWQPDTVLPPRNVHKARAYKRRPMPRPR
ncbi:hypothetical protein GA0070610_1747 [Micromonospora echinofusca]|uniref:Uncharacterized protein n=1 Tax=Micromonospora echinofusca TaxID=47858 RepID=A0A1C5G6F9_MICEH|nr:hypothetical protein [Micromonospora echinofusca]SCG15513.1 hypothetical protein GA0070610_1747 [Micromonospora echinofusca]